MSGTAAGGDRIHPDAGARFLLMRTAVDSGDAGADYDASVYTVDAQYDYRVRLTLEGTAAVTPRNQPAEPAVEATLSAIARSVARGAARRVSEGTIVWPRRILRWKGPGRG